MGYSTKFFKGRLRTGLQPLTPYIPFLPEKVPLSYTFYWQMVPLSHTLCIPLNCCKDTVFKIRINHKTRTFSRIFHGHKMLLWALLSLLTTEMTDFPTLSYTSTNVILTLWYTWSLKKLPLRAELPRIGHYREYPPPSRRRLRSRLLRPRTFNASAPGFILLSIQGRKLGVSNKLQYNHLTRNVASL